MTVAHIRYQLRHEQPHVPKAESVLDSTLGPSYILELYLSKKPRKNELVSTVSNPRNAFAKRDTGL